MSKYFAKITEDRIWSTHAVKTAVYSQSLNRWYWAIVFTGSKQHCLAYVNENKLTLIPAKTTLEKARLLKRQSR